MMKTIWYLLLDENANYVTITHQDDLATPLEAQSLQGLIAMLSSWSNHDEAYILKAIQADPEQFSNSGIFVLDDTTYQIVREQREEEPLTAAETQQVLSWTDGGISDHDDDEDGDDD